MSIQTEFIKFNEKIRVDFQTKKELAEKRDVLVNKLNNIEELPSFNTYNQGSYMMYTGIEPEEGEEYDIDVALVFNVNINDYTPFKLKSIIDSALENHTTYGAKIKDPCVTVTYKKDGEAKFHVDLVVYAYDNDPFNSQLYIGKGKNSDQQKWEKADPIELVKYINEHITEKEKRDQFRRIVRYLKKWKNRNFSNTGHVSPPSVGITLIALNNFSYFKNNDLQALIFVVQKIENMFEFVRKDESEREIYRIKLSLPYELKFEFNNNIFYKMTELQMTEFREKIVILKNRLISVQNEADEYEQYKLLNFIFGDDFNIPEESGTDSVKNFV